MIGEDGEGEGEVGLKPDEGLGEACENEVEVDELDPPKVLGDLLESIAGAIFIDSGMSLSVVWSVFQHHFHDKIGWYSK